MLVHRAALYAAVVAVTLLPPNTSRAQVAAPGSHVRIVPLNGGPRREGTLVVMMNDSITYRPGLSNTTLTMPMDSVRQVFASDGLRTRTGRTLRSGLIGAGIGMGSMISLGLLSCHIDNHDSSCGLGFYVAAVPAAVLGFLTGALIGHSHYSEDWERVYDRSQSTSLLIGPAPHERLAVGLSIPFGSPDNTH